MLYAAILEFINHRTGGDLPPQTVARLYQLREASEHIVRAVKEVKHMRGNTSRFTHTDQGQPTKLYNSLRIELARILIELNEVSSTDPEERSVLWLEDLRQQVQQDKKTIRHRVEHLMRSRRLKPHAASSFLNDAHYAYRAMKEMLEGARLLYAEPDDAMAEVERLLTMDEDDVEIDDDERQQERRSRLARKVKGG